MLSGEGKAFCAGLDMESFAAMKQAATPARRRDLTKRTHGIANRPQQCAWLWRALPVPVIAAVHGVAFGGGFQLALGADIRYATADTRFSVMEIKWGLVPDLAGTQLMRHLAREDVVRELTYTGRIFNGRRPSSSASSRARRRSRAAALETAKEIASKNPDAVAPTSGCSTPPSRRRRGRADGQSVEQQKLIGCPTKSKPSCPTCRSRRQLQGLTMNRQWLYAKQPQGKIAADTFEWTEGATPVSTRARCGPDAHALARSRQPGLDDGQEYRDALEPGQVMSGFAIGEVVESKPVG